MMYSNVFVSQVFLIYTIITVAMKLLNGKVLLSPTDLSNHLGCRHVTSLNVEVVLGKRSKPDDYPDPSLLALQERGLQHEDAYVKFLTRPGTRIMKFDNTSNTNDTITAMQSGYDVIVQAALMDDQFNGRADILLRVEKESGLGSWSYEVQDTKLANETKAGTVLQLAVYCDIISKIQKVKPEHFYVVKPGTPFEIEPYRFDDFRSYYNRVKKHLINFVTDLQNTYPDPVEQCHVCRWWKVCDKKRHDDDHLSLIANIRKMHIGELNKSGIGKMEQFAALDQPLPNAPERGSMEAFQRIHRQAKIQVEGKDQLPPLFKLFDPVPEKGLNRLPTPDEGDIYFDFEGDPFYPDGGLEYLFGIVYLEGEQHKYKAWWAYSREEERKAFNDFMDFVMARWKQFPGTHIYHYSAYEPSAIKRLASKHAIHEDNVSDLLRGELFVDLFSISKETMIVGVENYSIKNLEKLAKYTRECKLEVAGPARRSLEYILEFKEPSLIDNTTKVTVERYNEDDCRATLALHQWLEAQFNTLGNSVTRPPAQVQTIKDETRANIQARNDFFESLIVGLPTERSQRTELQQALWLLSYMVHYHYREDKNHWWTFHTVHEMEPVLLLDEKTAITGLTKLEELPKQPRQKIPRFRYSFPSQAIGLKSGALLFAINGDKKKHVATLVVIDTTKCEATIMHRPETTLTDVHVSESISQIYQLETALHEVIRDLHKSSFADTTRFKTARDLLLKRPPSTRTRNAGDALISEVTKLIDQACEVALGLNESLLAIQGPPGSGKTFTGAKIILALLKGGKKVGVTAVSHKVIHGLMKRVQDFATKEGLTGIQFIHKTKDTPDCPAWLQEIEDNATVINAIAPMTLTGATAYLWAQDTAEHKLDYLVVDEAGQMSLANVLAASRSASNLVLLGDPQQLEQPQQGSHPEGSDIAALTHLLDDAHTIQPHKGIFLGTTYRLHPSITEFTSDLYYEGRLHSNPGLENIAIHDAGHFSGAGLFFAPVEHTGRQTYSPEEVDVVKLIVKDLLGKASWTNSKEERKNVSQEDILIVAPYNDQVNALKSALPGMRIGTVDKFQGQEAAIVIYSVTCSSAADAPRGMQFLYSPNRLNVATSRAMCAVIMVGTESIFEAECRNIDQMKWVNGFCTYRQLSMECFYNPRKNGEHA
jgi:predicted RecB family nuclease